MTIVKKQRKKMNGYVIDRGVAISNEVYMNRHSGEFQNHIMSRDYHDQRKAIYLVLNFIRGKGSKGLAWIIVSLLITHYS